VVEYDPNWPAAFEQLRLVVWPAVSVLATSVEHVGSTSVPGLAAKPIIDISVVVPTAADVPAAIHRLAAVGYVHQGNLGVEGREAFQAPDSTPRRHLYLCPATVSLSAIISSCAITCEHTPRLRGSMVSSRSGSLHSTPKTPTSTQRARRKQFCGFSRRRGFERTNSK